MSERQYDGEVQREESTVGDQPVDAAIPSIETVAQECFNYAAWQNAVPLLHEVKVVNPTQSDLSSLKLEFSASPAFASSRAWEVDRVGAGAEVCVKNIDVQIDPEFLDRLDEATRGTLRFRLYCGDKEIVTCHCDIRVLARDEWGGVSAMGELLPAFVTPNDPWNCPRKVDSGAILTGRGMVSPDDQDSLTSDSSLMTCSNSMGLW